MRAPIFAGNWKMHNGPAETERFFASFLKECGPDDARSIAFFPPAVSLTTARQAAAAVLGIHHV